jgi:orotidine-5'-phosphate decarboxylase
MTGYAIPIVALDEPTAGDALAIARQLRDDCHFFKVGSTLYTAAGPNIVRELRDRLGADVFLDLKFHDIPNTVAGAVRSATAMGVRLLTVHASGGRAMLEAAAAAAGDRCGVLGVTVLTSLEGSALASAWGRGSLNVENEVVRLAGDCAAAGLHGVVCSGGEAAAVHRVYGDKLAMLIPGIRLPGGEAHDQRRVVTPHAAQRAGARYVVLGRTVTAAPDPRLAFRRVLTDLAADTIDGMPAIG